MRLYIKHFFIKRIFKYIKKILITKRLKYFHKICLKKKKVFLKKLDCKKEKWRKILKVKEKTNLKEFKKINFK